MSRKSSLLLFLLFIALSFSQLRAQCSDAGVCAIGSQHPSLRHQLGVSYTYAQSTSADGLKFHTVHFEGTFQLFENSHISIMLPFNSVKGPLGSTSGIGDMSLLWNQEIWNDPSSQLSIQFGGKFATGDDNAGNLPQAYQTSLGTNDLLLGIAYETEPWIVAVGYQLSRGRSDNAITRLKRGDDLLVRAGYRKELGNFHAAAEVLAIKRLEESSVLNSAIPGNNTFIAVAGSDQFQVNVLGKLSYPLFNNSTLQALFAVPLRNRKVNVDGLTRSVTLSLGLHLAI